jgi:hypothetical protein
LLASRIQYGEKTKCNAYSTAQPALLSRPRFFSASNMQASMHISQAQPIALAGRNEGSRSDCNADRRGLKSASCLAWLLMGKGLNEYLEDQEFIHRLVDDNDNNSTLDVNRPGPSSTRAQKQGAAVWLTAVRSHFKALLRRGKLGLQVYLCNPTHSSTSLQLYSSSISKAWMIKANAYNTPIFEGCTART